MPLPSLPFYTELARPAWLVLAWFLSDLVRHWGPRGAKRPLAPGDSKDGDRASPGCQGALIREGGDAGFVALDRAGIEAAPPQHAGDRTRQQARPHRLGRSRPRSRLSAEDRR